MKILSILCGSILIVAPCANAQVPTEARARLSRAAANVQSPFKLPSPNNECADALEVFQRHIEKQRWELAFKALERMRDVSDLGLAAQPDGIVVPVEILVQNTLAQLPPAGKEAYRLFHDAEAQAMLAKAHGDQEVEQLTAIINRYLITSAGDVAANRLGDIYFELGEVDRAAATWRLILDHRPDSTISRARLLTKIAIALSRVGRWDEFDQVQAELRVRNSDETTVLGGRTVDPVAHLAALEANERAERIATDDVLPVDFELPSDSTPLWQFRIMTKRDAEALAAAGPNRGWGQHPIDMTPCVAADAERVYVNLLGYLFALDCKTGKLIWRSAKFQNPARMAQRGPFLNAEKYSITTGHDRLWSIARNTDQLGEFVANFFITTWEPATGKRLISSQDLFDLKSWDLAGVPQVVGDCIYLAGWSGGENIKLYVLALQSSDLKLLWWEGIGTYEVNLRQVYDQRTPQPVLVHQDGRLFVDTNDGAVVELDADKGEIRWGLTYESAKLDTQHRSRQPMEVRCSAPPQIRDGTMYVKGMLSDRLYAIDLDSPKIKWKRPVPQNATIAAVDDDRIYLGGTELMAMDLASQQMAWSARLPQGSRATQPFVTQSRIYQFTSRGIYEIDKRTGAVMHLLRGADVDARGGLILRVPDAMITVSDVAVTAYALTGIQQDAAR